MTVTTEQCRAFIADFEKRNPQIEEARFYDAWGNNNLVEIHKMTNNPKNWKRMGKARPGCNYFSGDGPYMIYIDGAPVNKWAEPQGRIDFSEIAWERGFNCVPLDGQVAYMVLEKHDGTLLLSDYIGD